MCRFIGRGLKVSGLLLLGAFVTTLTAPVRAQNIADTKGQLGSIAGTVVDPNGDPVVSARVSVQGPGPSDGYSTVTNDQGFFELRNVKPGLPYRVTVHADRFQPWTSAEVILQPGQYKILTDCQLRLASVATSVNVTYSQIEVATQQVAAEEKQRVFGIAPNFYVTYEPNPAPMTTRLKFDLALKALSDPATVVGIGVVAGIRQGANSIHFQQGAKGYGQRFGVTAANTVSDIMLGSAILPSLLHQDPRYYYQGTGTTTSRITHALSHPFICMGDNGNKQFNFSSIGGDLASAALSNAYYPQSNRGASLVFGNFLIGTAEHAFVGLAQEFVLHKITSKPFR